MSKLLSLLGGNATVIGGGVAVAGVVSVGIYASGVLQKTAQPELSEPVALAQPADTNQPVKPGNALTPVVKPDPLVTTPAEKPEPVPAIVAILPTFDLVRVEPDGTTLIAGQAAAEAGISILMDGVDIGLGTTNSSGKFVAFLTLERSDKPRVLTLVQRRDAGDWVSQASVILAPSVQLVADVAAEVPAAAGQHSPAVPGAELAMATQTPAPLPTAMAQSATPEQPAGTVAPIRPAIEGQPVVAVPQPMELAVNTPEIAPESAPQAAAEVVVTVAPPVNKPASTPASIPVTQTVLLADQSGVRVLQAPVAAGAGPEVMSAVALDAISYSDSGDVALSGRGMGAGFVRIYLDNTPVSSSRISADGNWRTDLPDVDTGVYTLRVDQVTADGAVVSRVETPFKREDQNKLAEAAPVKQNLSAQVITVQPGSTLWAIARDTYGQGEMYVRVYEANRDRIRDPNLIYPGQVFAMPGQ